MKKSILILAVIVTAFAQHSIAQDTPTPLQQLLSDYYNIKDALVAGNAKVASGKAGDFIKTLNGIDYKVISEGNINVLLKDAGKIVESNDLAKQREVFSNFSDNLIAVAKAVKLSDKEIYLQYCPMKKASCLSSEKAIKYPYYGSSMLTCGTVKETLK
jgi:hypothetical protein